MFGLMTIKEHRLRLQDAIEAYRIAGIETANKLREEVEHWKYEAKVWKNLYEQELKKQ